MSRNSNLKERVNGESGDRLYPTGLSELRQRERVSFSEGHRFHGQKHPRGCRGPQRADPDGIPGYASDEGRRRGRRWVRPRAPRATSGSLVVGCRDADGVVSRLRSGDRDPGWDPRRRGVRLSELRRAHTPRGRVERRLDGPRGEDGELSHRRRARHPPRRGIIRRHRRVPWGEASRDVRVRELRPRENHGALLNPSKFVAARQMPASAGADRVPLAKVAISMKEQVPRLGDVVPAVLKNESRCHTCGRPLILTFGRGANVDEQPYTRDGSIWIPRDVHPVVVEVYDAVHGSAAPQ
jgi:hypothetical protein